MSLHCSECGLQRIKVTAVALCGICSPICDLLRSSNAEPLLPHCLTTAADHKQVSKRPKHLCPHCALPSFLCPLDPPICFALALCTPLTTCQYMPTCSHALRDASSHHRLGRSAASCGTVCAHKCNPGCIKLQPPTQAASQAVSHAAEPQLQCLTAMPIAGGREGSQCRICSSRQGD